MTSPIIKICFSGSDKKEKIEKKHPTTKQNKQKKQNKQTKTTKGWMELGCLKAELILRGSDRKIDLVKNHCSRCDNPATSVDERLDRG